MEFTEEISIDNIAQILMNTGSCILYSDDMECLGLGHDEIVSGLEELLTPMCNGAYADVKVSCLTLDSFLYRVEFCF